MMDESLASPAEAAPVAPSNGFTYPSHATHQMANSQPRPVPLPPSPSAYAYASQLAPGDAPSRLPQSFAHSTVAASNGDESAAAAAAAASFASASEPPIHASVMEAGREIALAQQPCRSLKQCVVNDSDYAHCIVAQGAPLRRMLSQQPTAGSLRPMQDGAAMLQQLVDVGALTQD